MVAHDLRTPLGTIAITAEKWEHTPAAPAELRRDGGVIVRCARRIERLLRDLLEAAHVDSGRLRVDVATHDLLPLLEQAIDAAMHRAGQRRLRLEAPAGPALAVCDAERVLQVLDNLLGNALKFTPETGTIALRLVELPGEVVVSVEDDGPGIEPRRLHGLFDRRWRCRERAPGEGWGLGLPISKGLVAAQGGRIWVESARGRGTRFSFSLRSPSTEPLPKALLLVAADAPFLRRSQRLLREAGFEVRTATGGAAARERLLREDPPGAILLGSSLPRRERSALRAALKRDAALELVPLVLVGPRSAPAPRFRVSGQIDEPLRRRVLVEIAGHYCAVSGPSP